MRAVGLKALKTRLSQYVRMAAGGETILVTNRDRVVAELVPPRAGLSPWISDTGLTDLVRKGWLTPPTSVGEGPPPRVPVMSMKDLLEGLDRDREDR